MPTLTRARDAVQPHPGSRQCLDGRVLAAAGYEDGARWREGERLEHVFEARCDELRDRGRADRLAVDAGDVTLTYAELDARANRLARFLVRRGVRPGDRIGLLFDEAIDSYAGMLAVLKAHAAYVPLDAAFPGDRLAFIAADASLRLVLTHSRLADQAESLAAATEVLPVDQVRAGVVAETTDRLGPGEVAAAADDLCYVIYTSGTTGRPKGVAITHASICNFVRVAAEVYGMAEDDRVYQGMTIAFDFSVEEIWVPWASGATLVPKPPGPHLLGHDLDTFLRDRQISALCCVPTLLATLEDDHPGLRFLLVSGESCPQDLISRWHRPGRRFLNVYGPTEATVTATWTLLDPDRRVTIGVPLPTYSVVILDPDTSRALPPGQMGEIGIAGIGLARGYLNRPDLTERAFIGDFLGIPGNPDGRIYRTGDLGQINAGGEIEHHGRIDTQVKIRGYRVELAEIESVLLAVPGIAQAAVEAYRPGPGAGPGPGPVELAAYYSPARDTPPPEADQIYAHLRGRLPSYMVPAYLEQLPALPVLPSGKTDRKSLPPPSGERRLAACGDYVAPAEGIERDLAELLASVLRVERVSADSHFFDDLGADSLLMARFNAAIRDRGDLPAVSMKDVYLHPTIRRLAAALAICVDSAAGPAPGAAGGLAQLADGPAPSLARPAERDAAPAGTPQYLLCGALQLLAFVGYAFLAALWLNDGLAWISASSGMLGVYARAAVIGGGGLLVMGALPVAAKWALIGRWKPQRIRVWSLAYVRFWVVKTLVIANPMARMFVGTPLYGLYLRALGAKVGRGAVIFTPHLPVCTDLLSIGPGAVIRKDSYLNGYRARAGLIETGPVTIGAAAFVGEQTVLDIGTVLGDAAQLGHSSALHAGQVVPAGQCWHGSPAQPADPGYNYQTVPPARCSSLRRGATAIGRLLLAVAVIGPLETAVAAAVLYHPAMLTRLLAGGPMTGWMYGQDAAEISAAAFFGLLVAGLLLITTVPRLLAAALQPGKVYPLFGMHYALQRAIARLTNIRFFNYLFGDSSAVVYYLRALGYRLTPVQQTGSNFGMAVKHEVPTLASVGTGTLVSDGLSFINAEFSATSFRVLPTAIGKRNFVGNGVTYPAGARVGDDCLIATKAMVPIAGPVREGVGLLGSPCFEIPRTVSRDHRFDHLATGPERRRRLAAKNRYNAATIGWYLLVRWFYLFGLALLALLAAGADGRSDMLSTASMLVADLAFTVGYWVLVDRAVTGFRRLRPQYCSIYQPAFWRHERFWKVPATAYIHLFSGTPYMGLIWRLLGVRTGRRLFDDGCHIVERSMVSVGSDATLNVSTTVQGHSLEDGAFKSGPITIGARATLGTGSFVHYGAVIGDAAIIDTDSFVMKGEHIPPRSRWQGNPAASVPDNDGSRPPAPRAPAD
jgi:non-ribosomal peptide synthetase-like protein